LATCGGLEVFSVKGNGLNGSIPTNLDALSKRSFVSLSNNHFSGQILMAIDNNSNLVVPSLRNNQFNGSIPIDSPLQIRWMFFAFRKLFLVMFEMEIASWKWDERVEGDWHRVLRI
jgi:hypothetical protein